MAGAELLTARLSTVALGIDTHLPAQIFANFGFMSILATVGTEKQDPKKPQGESSSKDEGGAQMMDMSP